VARSAFGLTSDAEPRIELVPVAADWPDVEEAHGGGPRLVTASSAHVDDADYAEEGISAPSFIGPNPRTFAGIAADGRVAFVGVDGRRPTAAGMSLPALAGWAVDLGLVDAVNLDGGGSTTVFVRGATPNGVVNYPSDAGEVELATHEGSRGVSGGFFVFAPPKARAPVFTSTPDATTAAGATYEYDADAYDANPADTITYSLGDPPSGASIDEATGVVTWQVPSDVPAQIELVVRASDGALATDQATTLTVRGGVGPGGSGGSGAAGGGGAGAGAADTSSGGASADGRDDGCSCATPQSLPLGRSSGIGLAALLLGLLSRRRRRSKPSCAP
jgi:hypothetical protein